MFECHWETVRKLAAKKKGMKIEIFYFFGFGWAKRALAGVTKNDEIIARWWGRADYSDLKRKSMTREDISGVLVERFEGELGYKHVTPYQIFKRQSNKRDPPLNFKGEGTLGELAEAIRGGGRGASGG